MIGSKDFFVALSFLICTSALASPSLTPMPPLLLISTEFATDSLPSQIENDQYLSHFFGYVTVGLSAFATLGITNNGDRILRLLKIEIFGPTFSFRSGCPRELPIGERCFVQIQYRPFFVGFNSGRFDIRFDDGKNIIVHLSGYGQ